MKFGKTSDIEVTRRLKHRPGVMLVKHNGHRKVIGDGDPLTPEEYIQIHGLAESTRERLQYTDAEQAELDAAQSRLDRAIELEAEIGDDLTRAENIHRAAILAKDAEAERAAENEGRDILRRLDEALRLHNAALIERNQTERRIQVAANARQQPVQYHDPTKSLDERLAEAEKS